MGEKVGDDWNGSWSFSSLELFRSCPTRYWALRHAKVVTEEAGAAATSGSLVHEKIEHYMKTGQFDLTLLKYKDLLSFYRNRDGIAEAEYAFDKDWNRLDDMKDKRVRCRMIIDWLWFNGPEAEMVDWKTGKVKPTKQLHLYAYALFKAHPEIERIKGTFHWINHRDKLEQWFERSKMEQYFAEFKATISDIGQCVRSNTWPESPGPQCRWCQVTTKHCSKGMPDPDADSKPDLRVLL